MPEYRDSARRTMMSVPDRRRWCCSPSAASTASAATTPRTRAKWGTIPDRELPFFFMKPADALVIDGADMPYPSDDHRSAPRDWSRWWRSAPAAADIAEADALKHVWGYAAGLDMTRRDLQGGGEEGSAGPGTWRKGFDHSAPIGTHGPGAEGIDPGQAASVELKVNGEGSADDRSCDMLIWSVPEDDRLPVQAGAAGSRVI